MLVWAEELSAALCTHPLPQFPQLESDACPLICCFSPLTRKPRIQCLCRTYKTVELATPNALTHLTHIFYFNCFVVNRMLPPHNLSLRRGNKSIKGMLPPAL